MIISMENGHENWFELECLYKQHYKEMQDRRTAQGINIADYNPRLKQYFDAFDGGWLINYVVRREGEAVGYSNVYLTNDMHNGELIAKEDAIYIRPDCRGNIGIKLTKFVLADLKKRGVIRAHISSAIDLKNAKIWRRIGFTDTAIVMTFSF